MNDMIAMTDSIYDQEIEAFIRRVFEQNYEELRLDSGHAISPDVKETALQQALLYWRTMRDVAENVTDTEVRLSLPGQETPAGRDFTIEGVVDIVRDNDRTVMYDIKTHDAGYVRANIDIYEQQLNVYAHIWHHLRGQALDEMAVIATNYPDGVRDALAAGDERHLAHALGQWRPLVPIDFNERRVDETIRAFGEVVDAIEQGQFAPPPAGRLEELMPGTNRLRFATHVCRNCDARFSCSSYRQYAGQAGGAAGRSLAFYGFAETPDAEQEAWRAATLDAAPDPAATGDDFTDQGERNHAD